MNEDVRTALRAAQQAYNAAVRAYGDAIAERMNGRSVPQSTIQALAVALAEANSALVRAQTAARS